MKLIMGLLVIIISTFSHSGDASFHEYVNGRFNFQVSYPTFMAPQTLPTNGAGRQFIGKEGDLLVYGGFYPNVDSQKNDGGFSIKDEFNFEQTELKGKGFQVGYTSIRNNTFVITATNGTTVIYMKKIYVQPCGVHLHLLLHFPQKDKPQWEPLVDKISHSFKYRTKQCRGDYLM